MKPIPTWQERMVEAGHAASTEGMRMNMHAQAEIDALRIRCAELERDAERHFTAGWKIAAHWANRDDLIADIGSPLFIRDRDAAMASAPKGE